MVGSTFCQDVVHCLVVSNYCIECQLLMSFVGCISERVIEKSLVLDVAMKVCGAAKTTLLTFFSLFFFLELGKRYS